MSDGSGGAPQLDEREQIPNVIERTLMKFLLYEKPIPDRRWLATRVAIDLLAACPGAGELDLTDEETWALLTALRLSGINKIRPWGEVGLVDVEPLRRKLRARLDRKDDDQVSNRKDRDGEA